MDFMAKKITSCHVYFSVQGVQDLFPDPLIYRGKADTYLTFEWSFITIPLSIRGSENKSFTARTEKQTSCAVNFLAKEFIFRVRNLKFSCNRDSLFFKILIIWQISHYLPKLVAICQINPANRILFAGLYPENKPLFAGLIRQISHYLPD